MNRYKIDPEIRNQIRHGLGRGYYKYFFNEENGMVYCETNCPHEAFRRIVARAQCEKKTKETGIFYVTFEEVCDSLFLVQLLYENHVTAYQIIDDPDGKKLLEIM